MIYKFVFRNNVYEKTFCFRSFGYIWSKVWTILLWVKTFSNDTFPSGAPISVGPKTTARLCAAIRFSLEFAITLRKWSNRAFIVLQDGSSSSLIKERISAIRASSSLLKNEGIWHHRAYCWLVFGLIRGLGNSRKNSFKYGVTNISSGRHFTLISEG